MCNIDPSDDNPDSKTNVFPTEAPEDQEHE